MWRFDGDGSHLQTAALNCDIDLQRPQHGLQKLTLGTTIVTGPDLQLLCLRGSELGRRPALVDAFVRGTDLVASYAEADEQSLRFQIYWRSVTLGTGAFGVDVILSVQTSRLDEGVELEILSQLPNRAQPLVHLEGSAGSRGPTGSIGTAHGIALTSCPYYYVEMAHPSNLASVKLQPAEGNSCWQLRHCFFPHRLEKGVIQRAMLRAVFLSSEVGPAGHQFDQLLQDFVESPPPLSA